MNTNASRFLPTDREARLKELDLEIVRLAIICKIRLLDPGIAERVLANDTSLCDIQHCNNAFRTLRGLLLMHYNELNAINAEADPQTMRVVAQNVRDALKGVIGGQLGGHGAMNPSSGRYLVLLPYCTRPVGSPGTAKSRQGEACTWTRPSRKACTSCACCCSVA